MSPLPLPPKLQSLRTLLLLQAAELPGGAQTDPTCGHGLPGAWACPQGSQQSKRLGCSFWLSGAPSSKDSWMAGSPCFVYYPCLWCRSLVRSCVNTSHQPISFRPLARWLSGNESTCGRRSHKRPGFHPGSGRSLEKEMAAHSSILAWKSHGEWSLYGLQSRGLQTVGHDCVPAHSISNLFLNLTFHKDTWASCV